jgi:hypothetical protein
MTSHVRAIRRESGFVPAHQKNQALSIKARHFEVDGRGKETEEPMDTWLDVAMFAETDRPITNN